ncbi:MAG: DUF2442 domain-containing protein [Planctomycetes bacterium]|nr:DUF2442 domain-containing protein [Planctomycetota bacterium]
MNREIIDVVPLAGYELALTFDGGEQRRVDVSRLVDFRGIFERLRDPAYFRQVSVNKEIGTIVWPNGADLCPDVLFENGAFVAGAVVEPGRD